MEEENRTPEIEQPNTDPYQPLARHETGSPTQALVTMLGVVISLAGALFMAIYMFSAMGSGPSGSRKTANAGTGADKKTEAPASRSRGFSVEKLLNKLGDEIEKFFKSRRDKKTSRGPRTAKTEAGKSTDTSAPQTEPGFEDLTDKFKRVPLGTGKYGFLIQRYKNTGSQAIGKPSVKLQFLDANSNIIKKMTGFGQAPYLKPGKSTIIIASGKVPEDYSKILGKYAIRPYAGSPPTPPQLKFSGVKVNKGYANSYRVKGVLSNNDSRKAKRVTIVVTLQDFRKRLVGAGTYYLSNLPSGMKRNFSFSVYSKGKPRKYTIKAHSN